MARPRTRRRAIRTRPQHPNEPARRAGAVLTKSAPSEMTTIRASLREQGRRAASTPSVHRLRCPWGARPIGSERVGTRCSGRVLFRSGDAGTAQDGWRHSHSAPGRVADPASATVGASCFHEGVLELGYVDPLPVHSVQLTLKILTFLKKVKTSQGVRGFQLMRNGLQSTLDGVPGALAASLGSAGLERLKVATYRSALLSALGQRSLVRVAHGRASTRPRLRRCRLLGHRLLLVGWLQSCASAEVDEVNIVVTRQARTEEKHGRSSVRVRRPGRRRTPHSPEAQAVVWEPRCRDPFSVFAQAALRLRAVPNA